jgi:hypothetical protein
MLLKNIKNENFEFAVIKKMKIEHFEFK